MKTLLLKSSLFLCLILMAGCRIMESGAHSFYYVDYSKQNDVKLQKKMVLPDKAVCPFIIKKGDHNYLLIGDEYFMSVMNKDTTILQSSKSILNNMNVIAAKLIKNKLFLVLQDDNNIFVEYLSPDNYQVINKSVYKFDENFNVEVVDYSNNDNYISILINKDKGESIEHIIIDENLKNVSEVKIDVEKELSNNGDYEYDKCVGSLIDSDGTAFICLRTKKFSDSQAHLMKISKNSSLTHKMDILNLSGSDFINISPAHVLFVKLSDGSLLCATSVTNQGFAMYNMFVSLIKFNPTDFSVLKKYTYKTNEQQNEILYGKEYSFIKYFPGIFESPSGDILVVADAMFEYYEMLRIQTNNQFGNKSSVYQLKRLDSKFWPITILNFSKDLDLKWEKQIPRKGRKTLSVNSIDVLTSTSRENKINCESIGDKIRLIYHDIDTTSQNVRSVIQYLNFNGELSTKKMIYSVPDHISLVDAKIYSESDNSFSFFTCYNYLDKIYRNEYWNIKMP